jgi:hypothetical protein
VRLDRGRTGLLAMSLLIGSVAGGCITMDPTRNVSVIERDGSGVVGTVTMVQLGEHRTRLEIRVSQPAGADMPAHVHLGECNGEVTPQPKYPLANVQGGRSVTEIPVAVTELETIAHVVNIHKSNDQLNVVVACAQLSWSQGTLAAPPDSAATGVPPASHSMGSMGASSPAATSVPSPAPSEP